MATTYAAYANVMHANKTQVGKSARSSVSSTSTTNKKSTMARILDEFKPVETPQEPVGIYTPIIKPVAKSARSSVSSTSTTNKKSIMARILNEFKPIETAEKPVGIYAPIIKQGPLFEKKQKSQQ